MHPAAWFVLGLLSRPREVYIEAPAPCPTQAPSKPAPKPVRNVQTWHYDSTATMAG